MKELDLREQIEKAIEQQDIDRMTTDMLIMKIKLMQSHIDNIDQVFKDKDIPKSKDILSQLKQINSETFEDKFKLIEKLKFLEKENQQ